MARYLLDTSILSDAMWNRDGPVVKKIARVGQDQVCTSIIVASEMRYGAANRGSSRVARRVSELLSTIDVLALEPPVDRVYGDLRVTLERAGRIIGPNDLLIAAQAIALGMTLVTDNEREFSRVPGLRLENWLRPMPN
jgi:tRNA(fMet)-specific endonuclease VapC